jgi:hypothetical protein
MIVPAVLVLGQAGARTNEGADSGPTFDPSVTLQVVQRPPNRRAAQARDASELMVGQKSIADVRPIAQEMLDELLAQRDSGASSGERGCHFENTLH